MPEEDEIKSIIMEISQNGNYRAKIKAVYTTY